MGGLYELVRDRDCDCDCCDCDDDCCCCCCDSLATLLLLPFLSAAAPEYMLRSRCRVSSNHNWLVPSPNCCWQQFKNFNRWSSVKHPLPGKLMFNPPKKSLPLGSKRSSMAVQMAARAMTLDGICRSTKKASQTLNSATYMATSKSSLEMVGRIPNLLSRVLVGINCKKKVTKQKSVGGWSLQRSATSNNFSISKMEDGPNCPRDKFASVDSDGTLWCCSSSGPIKGS